jgi:hypothetical protein
MRRLLSPVLCTLALLLCWQGDALRAFCGFYVAKADTSLFNRASQVVLARDGDRTVLTMASDFKGEPKEFAVVIPVPTFITREQIHIAEKALIDHIDAYTAPRLVEYFDSDPCRRYETRLLPAAQAVDAIKEKDARTRALGVTIEAQYTVGEYDILILSAKQSGGLETWLKENGYRIPAGAGPVIGSYLRQNMRFFVARVNLSEQARLGFTYLRPLQVAYESPKFMLPIRLGTVNANGPQELFIYTLTRTGRVETTNYRTVKLPSGSELPPYIKDDFPRFYRAMFEQQVRRESMSAVFLEYAWDMAWCDPCAADPMSASELKTLGVFWAEGDVRAGQNVFVTRLHVRYDAQHFPEDLVFQQTGDRENFQGRYVLRHAWTGGDTCPAATDYKRTLSERREKEVQTLSNLTGWRIEEIRKQASLPGPPTTEDVAWWRRIWK